MASTITYAENTARRILSGTGALTLVPYRVDPARSVPALGHGVDEQGRIIVVCAADEAECMGDTPVRVDGVKKGLEVDVDIVVASIHALGLVTWCAPGVEIPGLGIEASPYLRFGIVEAETLFIRTPNGITRCEVADLWLGEMIPGEITHRELDVRDEVVRLSERQLAGLVTGVLVGMIPGVVLSDREQQVCPGARHRLAVADVDRLGLVVMETTDTRVTAVLARFPHPVSTLESLAGAVDALAAQTSVRDASPRI